jgi:polar amino acid transport system substrate-binding protein
MEGGVSSLRLRFRSVANGKTKEDFIKLWRRNLMKKLYSVLVLAIVASLILAACGAGGGAKADNLLDAIKQRGYILVSTDPNYAPQSALNTKGKRPADTKCPSDALTSAEMEGFDVDVAKAIGDDLGVETCFATPSWDAITAGNWANKWDVSVGSMTIKPAREKVLDFSVPYYFTPAVVAVRADSDITSLDQLSGKALCVGSATTYEDWLNGKLDIRPEDIYAQPPTDVQVVSLETDQECAQAIAAGRQDFVGYVTSGTVVDANIAASMPVKELGDPVFIEHLAAAFDKSSALPTNTLRAEVDKLFNAMHSDGRLAKLSTQWFGSDLTQTPK